MSAQAGKEPTFLTREEVDALHSESIEKYGGDPGLRNEDGLESAIAQPQQVHHYTDADHYEIAGAYAYHIAENQPYVDGNKRTAMAAATAYLESNGIDASRLPEDKAYDTMIGVSAKEVNRQQVGDFLRSNLGPQQEQTVQQENVETLSQDSKRDTDTPMPSKVEDNQPNSVEQLATSYAEANPDSGASPEEHQEAAYFAHAVEDSEKYPPLNDEMKDRVDERRSGEQFEKDYAKAVGVSREQDKGEQMQERMEAYMSLQKQHTM